GEVNAADLTQIAVHLGKNTESSDWEAARLADGDNNGIVSISDITPLGLNFRNSVQAYRLENSADGSSGWSEVATVTVAQGSIPQGGGEKIFSHLMNGAPDGHYRVVPFAGSEDGPASNTA